VGIAPSVYADVFKSTPSRKRKDKDGKIIKWTTSFSFPHLSVSYSADAAGVAETAMINDFSRKLVEEEIANEQN
jgi:hypothetical protein